MDAHAIDELQMVPSVDVFQQDAERYSIQCTDGPRGDFNAIHIP